MNPRYPQSFDWICAPIIWYWLTIRGSRVECNLSGLRTHQMLWNILLMKSCKNLAILLVIAKLLYFINLIDGNLSTESRIFQKEANVVGVHLIVKRFKIFFLWKKENEKKYTAMALLVQVPWCREYDESTKNPRILTENFSLFCI